MRIWSIDRSVSARNTVQRLVFTFRCNVRHNGMGDYQRSPQGQQQTKQINNGNESEKPTARHLGRI